jgi:alkanesulfonate monooxygenase SsuD/methylene tetrahydromethanopterin reductase-like flavin-dependent oxidoreductase (luciferase family)
VKIGVTLPVFTDDASVFIDGARRARDAGLDSVWVFDHLWPIGGTKQRPILESYTALAYLAEAVPDVTIGTLVTRASLRHPLVLAKMVATVATIAPGRVIVAIGSGDALSRPENEAFGYGYPGREERIEALESSVLAVREHLRGDGVLSSGPRPAIRPPVWVAGRSAAVRDVAGRSGDGWNCWGASPEEFVAENASVRAAAGGRRVEPTWGGLAVIASSEAEARAKLGKRDPSQYLVGGVGTLKKRLGELASAGCSHAIVTFPDAGHPGSYEMLGRTRPVEPEQPNDAAR